MLSILLPLLAGFVFSVVLTPVTIRIALRTGAVARPAEDRWNRREVPVLGGAAIYAGFLGAVLLTAPWDAGVAAILAGGTILFLVGIVDDVVRLRPSTKLVAQVVAAALLVALGVEARFVENRLITIPVTIFWVVGITNAMNLIDNMDGLCAGVGTIAAGAIAAYAGRFQVAPFPSVLAIALALAGAQAGFLVYNVNPARTFMGDSGALVLGFVLSASAILGTYEHAGNLFLILAVPVFVLGVPIFDTTFVTVMRKLSGRKVSQGGKDHLSHRLVALGMSERRAVFILWSICALLAALGLAASWLDLFANLFLMGVTFIAVVIFAIFLGETAIYRPAGETGGRTEGGVEEEIRKTFVNYVRGTSLVLLDVCLIGLAYLAAYLVIFEGEIPSFDRERLLESLPVVIIAKTVFFHAFRIYQGIWRYFGVRDLLAVLWASASGSVASVVAIVLLFRFTGYSRAVFVMDGMMLFLLVAGSRLLFRALLETSRFPPAGRRVLLVGAGDRGELCLRALRTRNGGNYCPIGILDDRPELRRRKLLGVTVLGGLDRLEQTVAEKRPEELILAVRLPPETLSDLRARCRALDLPLLLAPHATDFVEI